MKYYNLIPETKWQADLEHLEAQIDGNTAAIVLNNPSNPCGSNYSEEHLRSILEIAYRWNIILFCTFYLQSLFQTSNSRDSRWNLRKTGFSWKKIRVNRVPTLWGTHFSVRRFGQKISGTWMENGLDCHPRRNWSNGTYPKIFIQPKSENYRKQHSDPGKNVVFSILTETSCRYLNRELYLRYFKPLHSLSTTI